MDVRPNEGIDMQTPITGIFWGALSAGGAVTELLSAGIPETDIDAVGILTGSAPDLSDFLTNLGIPTPDAVYYNDCFQDGAVLVIVHTHMPSNRRRALKVISRHGGIFPQRDEVLSTAV
jgi:hypothetical protein